MKTFMMLAILLGSLLTVRAWNPVTIDAGTIPAGQTGSIAISISGLDDFDYTVVLNNETTGDIAAFSGYTGLGTWANYYRSGVWGSIDGQFAAWTWSLYNLPPGKYSITYEAAWMGHAYGTDLSPYLSVTGAVDY